MTPEQITAHGYMAPRQLPNGDWIALTPFLFTVGLVVGIDEFSYRTRFCYPDFKSALAALLLWDGNGDPPGPWIKEKGRVERTNPNLGNIAGVPVKEERESRTA